MNKLQKLKEFININIDTLVEQEVTKEKYNKWMDEKEIGYWAPEVKKLALKEVFNKELKSLKELQKLLENFIKTANSPKSLEDFKNIITKQLESYEKEMHLLKTSDWTNFNKSLNNAQELNKKENIQN